MADEFLLLNDGTSKILLNDGTSKLLLNSGSAPATIPQTNMLLLGVG